ncbi:MAG TPA: beta-ketoacyl synthase chain length factor [Aliidongia sp.]|nr:beta-ketoacyl synthase chain length factor [Aliidongia sp.]
MRVHIDGVGLIAPGLPSWCTGREALAGPGIYRSAEVALAPSELLPPAERRRMTDTVKLALAVGAEAMAAGDCTPGSVPSVFTSSGGDGTTITAILEILASPEREVSPTRFHNSVHNAPSGYWSIANRSNESSTSLCGHDHSFGAGLIEAASLALHEDRQVLLVSYDVPYPSALHRVRPIEGKIGIALLLSPKASGRSLASLTLTLARDTRPETVMPAPGLEALRQQNPTGRGLPLLAALARGVTGSVVLDHIAGNRLILGLES